MRWKSWSNEAYYALGAGIRFTPTKNTYLAGSIQRYVENDELNNDWFLFLGTGIEF